MRNISTATQNFAAQRHGELPYLSGIVRNPLEGDSTLIGDMSVNVGTETKPVMRPVGWPVAILPNYDSNSLYDALNYASLSGNEEYPGHDINTLAATRIHGFTCPDDSTGEKPGSLSYVANAGLMPASHFEAGPSLSLPLIKPTNASDVDGTADQNRLGITNWRLTETGENRTFDNIAVDYATRLFLRPNVMTIDGVEHNFDRRITLSEISHGDGLVQTLMYSENIQAGPWISDATADIGFGWPVTETSPSSIAPNTVAGGTGPTDSRTSETLLVPGPLKDSPGRINSSLDAEDGTRPRPSSGHKGVVNVMYCDGHGGGLNERIDSDVYVRLLTPNGTTFGERPLNDSLDF